MTNTLILYNAADLMWASKIKATAESLGLAARPVRTLDMLEARLTDPNPPHPVALLVDLDSPPELALSLINRAREFNATHTSTSPDSNSPHPTPNSPRRLQILAWGPHVAKDLLDAAKSHGADEVMTRGALNHTLDQVLVRLASHA
ncbi:MAG: hypothetical protein AB7Q00_12750 [Phycisphaerales bacterium]|nr:MAG: hypothetical protein IPK69_03435 [Phycisphaerales bacterium]